MEDYTYRLTILLAENERLKKKVRDLEYRHILDQSSIMNLRRQIEWFDIEYEQNRGERK